MLHESAVYRGQFVELRMQECMWDKLSNDIYNSCTSPMNNAPLRRALYIPGPGSIFLDHNLYHRFDQTI